MMEHRHFQERLAVYAGGDLDAQAAAELRAHLAECPACAAELAELQQVREALKELPAPEPPPWLTTRIMTRVREEATTARQPWWRFAWLPKPARLSLEALALLLVCVTGYFVSQGVAPEVPRLSAPPQKEQVPAPPAPAPPAPAPPSIPPPQPASTPQAPPADAKKQAPTVLPESRAKGLASPPAPVPAASDYAVPPPGRGGAERAAEAGNGAAPAAAPSLSKERRQLEAAPKLEQAAPVEKQAVKDSQERNSLATSQPELRIALNEPGAAPGSIRQAISRAGGTLLPGVKDDERRLRVLIPASRYPELLRELQRLGRLTSQPVTVPNAGQLDLQLRW